ncbi:MAG: hypothetical protein AAB588_02620 [Patescibacteria group bacterium]
MRISASKIILSVCSLLLVVGTLFVEERLGQAANSETSPDVAVLEQGAGASVKNYEKEGIYEVASGSASRLSLSFSGNALARLAPSTLATFILSENKYPRHLNILLKQGRVWFNGADASVLVSVKTDAVTFTSQSGVFDAQYKAGVLTITALRHPVEIAFLESKIILPEGNQISINESKIKGSAEAIKKLHTSKLLKEFPFVLLEKEDDWMKKNKQDDATFLDAYEKRVVKTVRDSGFGVSDDDSMLTSVSDVATSISNFLTFDSQKKAQKVVEKAMSYFDAGSYALLVGNDAVASRRFSQFTSALSQANFADSQSWKKELQIRLDRFAFADPSDSFAKAKMILRTTAPHTVLGDLKLAFYDVLDTAAAGQDSETQQKVISSLRRFGSQVQAAQDALRTADFASDVFFMDIALNDFLQRSPAFMVEEFYKISEIFQRTHLALLTARDEADDQRQFFISEKLKTISQLKTLMESGAMPFQNARRGILLMSNQIEALKPTFSDTAVLAYFDGQLKTLAPFVSFLRSSEAERLHGSFQENYVDFQKRQEELQKVSELLSSADGGTQISAARREELANVVSEDLGSLNASDVQIVLPDLEDEARVKIVSAKIEGKDFSAIYDTARKVFTDITFDGEKTTYAVRLENLQKFLLVKLGKLVLQEGQTPESLTEAPSQQSVLEKVTKNKLIEDLKKIGILVEDQYVGTEDLEEGVMHIRLARLGEGTDSKVFSFDVSQKESVVSNLKVQTVSGEIPVNDEFALRELPIKVEQIYQRAVFEKLKEEGLKDLESENE